MKTELDKGKKQRPPNYNHLHSNIQVESNIENSAIYQRDKSVINSEENIERIQGKELLPVDNKQRNYPPCVEFITIRDNNIAHDTYSSIM